MSIKPLIVIAMTALTFSAHAGVWSKDRYYSMTNAKDYEVYIPEKLIGKKNAPVVVMLHGCTQSPEIFATGTRIEKWADKHQFIAIFPEQSTLSNPKKCWNWFLPINQNRTGEPAAIVGILDKVIGQYKASKEKVFVAGMSAGAGMANVLVNCYPERFKAIASHDGPRYLASAYELTNKQQGKDVIDPFKVPTFTAAALGFQCSGFGAFYALKQERQIPSIIFHSDNSPSMPSSYATEVEEQLLLLNDFLDNSFADQSKKLTKTTRVIPDGKTYGFTHTKHLLPSGKALIEKYIVNHQDHSWSGGDDKYPYNDPNGPDASKIIFDFFKQYGL